MKRTLLSTGTLCLLLFAIDQLYRWLHPEVDLLRAALVGATALAALSALAASGWRRIEPWRGALAIFASAAGSVLSIEAGLLVSRSLVSGIVHVAILAAVFPLLEGLRGRRAPARAR
jgi:hypothetical protein